MIKFYWKKKSYLWQLVWREFQATNSGTILGKYWLLIDPLIYVFLTVFFFQQTMKGTETLGVPYIAWVMPGILMWMYISTAINSSYNAFRDYSYLIRESNFKFHAVIIVKILSALFVHVFALIVMIAILMSIGYYHISDSMFRMPYYLFAVSLLIFPIGIILASITLFWPDFKNIFSIFMQVEFWLSPIFWDAQRFPGVIGDLMTYNLFYFPIQGYRNALIGSELGQKDILLLILNGITILGLMYIAKKIYKNLKPGFGDVI